MRDVAIVGAGPAGLLLAAELSRRGVDAAVFERRRAPGGATRAIGLHAATLAALEPGGVTDRLLAEATRVTRGEARGGPDSVLLGTVRFDRLSLRFPFVATLPQPATEAALAAGGPEAIRGARVVGVDDLGDRVRLRIENDGIEGGTGGEVEARVAVIAAGAAGRGLVFRDGALAQRDYRDRYLMTDIPGLTREGDARTGGPVAVVHLDRHGVLESFPLAGGRRFVLHDDRPDDDAVEAQRERVRRRLTELGHRAAAERVESVSAFGIRRVIAPRLRRGRRLVIGDAAHEISPIGGQGMNLGLLDAATLAPLLAEWVKTGDEPGALAPWERRRIASARLSARISAMNTALGRPMSARGDAVRAAGLRAALATPAAPLLAHAYAMGFDRDSRR